MSIKSSAVLVVFVTAAVLVVAVSESLRAQAEPPGLTSFLEATREDDRIASAALRRISASWGNNYAAMLVDLARMMRGPRRVVSATADEPATTGFGDSDDAPRGAPRGDAPEIADRGSPIRRRLLEFLGRQTGQRFGDDLDGWRSWIWSQPYQPHPDYAALKGIVYGQIDPRMRAFFPAGVKATIRLDQIDWGGVKVNGIPPLRQPKVVSAPEASYLRDSHVVFGLVINGEARAYPKRILGWHEMAIDRIGDVDLTIVYCTLCGTVIPYESVVNGRHFRFGTSGLLYQSNKLMFDEDTNSLWSTARRRRRRRGRTASRARRATRARSAARHGAPCG